MYVNENRDEHARCIPIFVFCEPAAFGDLEVFRILLSLTDEGQSYQPLSGHVFSYLFHPIPKSCRSVRTRTRSGIHVSVVEGESVSNNHMAISDVCQGTSVILPQASHSSICTSHITP